MFFSGILLGLVIVLGFRVMYYGNLSNTIIQSDNVYPGLNSSLTLREYSTKIQTIINSRYTNNSSNSTADLIAIATNNLVKATSQGINNFKPFAIMPVSLYLGFFFSYLIYFGFAKVNEGIKKFDRKFWFWFLFFSIPAFLGFLGASVGLSREVGYELTIVFLIYYASVPLVRAWLCLVSAKWRKRWNRLSKGLVASLFLLGVILFICFGLDAITVFDGFFRISTQLKISFSVGSVLFISMAIFLGEPSKMKNKIE